MTAAEKITAVRNALTDVDSQLRELAGDDADSTTEAITGVCRGILDSLHAELDQLAAHWADLDRRRGR